MKTTSDSRGAENQRILHSYLKELYPNLNVFYEFTLPNGMRYDLFIPSLGICVEYDGEQHSNYISHFHKDINGYLSGLKSDSNKDQLSYEKGVKIVRIAYDKMVSSKEELLSLIESTPYPDVEYDQAYFMFQDKKRFKYEEPEESKNKRLEAARKIRKERYQKFKALRHEA